MIKSTFSFLVALALGSALAISPAAARGDRDKTTCVRGSGDEKIAACSRVIDRGDRESREERSGAFVARALVYSERGDYDLAIRDLDEATSVNPRNSIAFNNRGYNYGQKGDYDRAIRDYEESLQIAPRSALTLGNRAEALVSKGEYDRAITDLDSAAQIEPKNGYYLYVRARAYELKGDYDRALRDCDEAIHVTPNEAGFYARRGDIYRDKTDNDQAIRSYDEALRLNPKNWYADYGRALAEIDKGDKDQAVRDLDEALRLNPQSVDALNTRGFIFRMNGDYDRALRDLDEVIRLNPKTAVAYSNRGDVWRRKGDMDRAIADLSEALRLMPTITPAIVSRGQAYEAKGDVDKAKADYQAALQGKPGKFTTTNAALDTARQRLAALNGPPTTPAAAPANTSKPAAVANVMPSSPNNASATDGERGPRVALVIGNGAYTNVAQLPNPPNDARDVAGALRDLGFKVIEGYNLDSTKMRSKIEEFSAAMPGAGVTLLYYAGHGIQVAGKNYLIPVDAKLEHPSALGLEAIEVTTVISDMESEKRINLVFLDACRDNPLSRSLAGSMGTRSLTVGQGLASVNAGIGTLITFATSPDTTALDGSGRNSPFTTALLNHIRTPGLEVRTMLTRVRADVIKATNERQVPWDHSSLTGEFYFKPGG
jgi:tetratricopeptide (TPR) repeat protein